MSTTKQKKAWVLACADFIEELGESLPGDIRTGKGMCCLVQAEEFEILPWWWKDVFREWEHFSGNHSFPVPDVHEETGVLYSDNKPPRLAMRIYGRSAEEMWGAGDYAELRRHLCAFVSDWLREYADDLAEEVKPCD
jgi:hypothetical protein